MPNGLFYIQRDLATLYTDRLLRFDRPRRETWLALHACPGLSVQGALRRLAEAVRSLTSPAVHECMYDLRVGNNEKSGGGGAHLRHIHSASARCVYVLVQLGNGLGVSFRVSPSPPVRLLPVFRLLQLPDQRIHTALFHYPLSRAPKGPFLSCPSSFIGYKRLYMYTHAFVHPFIIAIFSTGESLEKTARSSHQARGCQTLFRGVRFFREPVRATIRSFQALN